MSDEPLCPELAARLDPPGERYRMIRHPLIHTHYFPDIPPFEDHPGGNAHYNEALKAKRKIAAKAKAERDWFQWLFIHEKPHRIDAFRATRDLLSDREYWEQLANVWTNQEFIFRNYQGWHRLWKAERLIGRRRWERKYRRYVMSVDERKVLRSLPDPIVVYRGSNLLQRVAEPRMDD
jgi:hypothetical protein